MNFFILIAELIGLYILTRQTTQILFGFFLLLFGKRTLAVTLITLLLFPGTVIHELAHLFVAEILGVKTGKLTLVPENIRAEGLPAGRQEIQTGSVTVAHSDPFRRAVVGLAPLLVGLAALVAISYLLIQQFKTVTIVIILLFYLLFAIAGSMFPSSQDLKGTPALLLTLALFALAGYVVGIRIGLTGQALELAERILTSLAKSLGVVLAVNIILLLMLQILATLATKILHRRRLN